MLEEPQLEELFGREALERLAEERGGEGFEFDEVAARRWLAEHAELTNELERQLCSLRGGEGYGDLALVDPRVCEGIIGYRGWRHMGRSEGRDALREFARLAVMSAALRCADKRFVDFAEALGCEGFGG